MKKFTYAVGLVILILLADILHSRGQRTAGGARAAVPVAVASVTRTDLARTITLSAEFEPNQVIEVHAKVAGYVRSIRVDVGDHVKTGDTIATLEIPELDDDLKKAEAATRAANEDMRRALAHHADLHLANQRLLQVAKERPNLVAQQDIDAATATDQEAEAALASATERIDEAKANESRMHTMFAYGTITAPFDGVITKRYADIGALIQSGTSSNTQAMPVVSLAQDRLLRLLFPVPESAVSSIKDGTAVDVEVPALHRTFKGKVARYSGQVERATRTMHTEVDVANKDLQLTPGMYASVTIALEEHQNALGVPVQALSGHSVLAVGANNILERRNVRVGLETPDRVEILEGLKEGDLVVLGGSELQPGDRVTPKIQEEPAKEGS